MAKGKKTTIKEYEILSDSEVTINGKEYIIIESYNDITDAKFMKITSNGNRILKFEDENKSVKIDVKRDLNIVKYSFKDKELAKKFKKGHDKSLLDNKSSTKMILGTSDCQHNARNAVASFFNKGDANFDKNAGVTTFYLIEDASI